MIVILFYTYNQLHFTSENAYFLWYLCVFWKSFCENGSKTERHFSI